MALALQDRDVHTEGVTPALRRTHALIGALTLLTATILLFVDGIRNGDLYLQLLSGRFISAHGIVSHDPFPTIAHGELWLNQQWLSELTFFQITKQVGVTGLTIVYAALLAGPLALLLRVCRHRGVLTLIAIAALYCPGLWVVIHPRAAGFTVLGFSLLVFVVVQGWIAPRGSEGADRSLRWAVPAIAIVFALWANLHGGFVAGLLLIGLVTVGLAIDRWRSLPSAVDARRVALLGLSGAVAAAIVTVATPLGGAIWSYVVSFRNPAITLASSEWGPSDQAAPAIAYLGVAAAFAIWLCLSEPAPRRMMPPLVSAGFLLFGLLALRNIIFVAPALALQAASSIPNRRVRPSRAPIALAGLATTAVAFLWLTTGPARDARPLGSRLVDYALAHPPRHGYIAAYSGVGSYMLWRSPHTPVVLDGWLEHFSPFELRGAYSILDGWRRNPAGYVRALNVGAVVADRGRAIRALQRQGFVKRFSSPDGAYLIAR
jgi:hypothetical protein